MSIYGQFHSCEFHIVHSMLLPHLFYVALLNFFFILRLKNNFEQHFLEEPLSTIKREICGHIAEVKAELKPGCGVLFFAFQVAESHQMGAVSHEVCG